MNPVHLIPAAEPIPAPAWLFIVLEHSLFLIHIILINIVLGGSILALFARRSNTPGEGIAELLRGKLPVILPFAINLGVTPLLFLQVVYGHLFYSSSVLMAVYWISIIPLLVIAYYGTYVSSRRLDRNLLVARFSMGLATFIFFYIGFVLVNNLSLMVQPEHWDRYFENRRGLLLNMQDPTVLPRYLHFIVSSIAVAALVAAVLAARGRSSPPAHPSETRGKSALRVFGIATLAQLAVGSWYLMALPRNVIRAFMGQDTLASVMLLLGVLAGLGAAISALRCKLRPALIQAAITLVFMIVTRAQLRSFYLEPHFKPADLAVQPQLNLLILFLVTLLLGLAMVFYMVRIAYRPLEQGGGR